MKRTILVSTMALLMAACAHETTTMDRELALKIADKAPVIVQSAAPVVNVYNGGNFGHQQDQSSSVACNDSPVYGPGGVIMRYEKHCYGGN